jgi:hypothetical protein
MFLSKLLPGPHSVPATPRYLFVTPKPAESPNLTELVTLLPFFGTVRGCLASGLDHDLVLNLYRPGFSFRRFRAFSIPRFPVPFRPFSI